MKDVNAQVLCALLSMTWLLGCGDGSAPGATDGSAPASTSDGAPETAATLPGSGSGPCASIPAACPVPAPSYAKDIAPILDAKCNTCHAAPDAGIWPLTNYQDVSDWQTLILSDVEYCAMPPAGAAQLSAIEQSALLAWVVCGAPE